MSEPSESESEESLSESVLSESVLSIPSLSPSSGSATSELGSQLDSLLISSSPSVVSCSLNVASSVDDSGTLRHRSASVATTS